MEKELFELTSPQKSIWLTEQFYKGTPVNNLCGTVHIDEKINVCILEKALNCLIKNNSNFLINFKLQNGNLMQYLTDYKYFNIEIVDVQSNSDIEALEEKLKFRVFEIENNYLFDFKIFKFPDSTGGFVFSCHHLLGDSWSLGLVAKESIKAYSLLISGSNDEFSSSNYFDYCINEKKYLNSDKFNKDKEYWNTVFSTIPELASIPSKNKISNNDVSCKASRNTYALPKNIMEQINAFCKINKISVFNFIMSVYSLYISRVSNLKDFVIGTPILNRSNFNEKNTMGMFVSTAPLRINLENKNTFLDLASNIAQDSMSMLRHQKYPYNYILKDLRENNPHLPNLYNVLISYQITKTTNDALKHTTSWSFNGTCADEMQIHILDLNDTGILNVAYDYKTLKYTSSEIDAIHKRIIHIINQIMQNNSILLEKIEIVTPDEKNELLCDFNNTDFDYDKTKTIARLFEEQVQKTPERKALVFEGKSLTYKELNEKANALANYLIKTNLKQGDIVGVLVNRSLEMIVGMLAIIKSGCTYLPIDPEYPSDRISYMLENSGASAILVHNNTSDLISDDFTKINIELDSKIYESENTKNLELKFSPNNLLYLIYTSGSTGKPKGVMLTHKNIHNFINGIKNKIDFSSNKTIVSLTTICFDIFVLEAWCSLCSGLKVVLANEKEQVSPELFNKLCLENNVNIIQTTPSRYNAFLENDEFTGYLKNVTDILIGGEPLPDRLLKKLKKYSSANIYNMYGPTETAVWSTVQDLTKTDEITIGYPMVNTKCYILDENQNLLPKFTPGNLYIGGDGVSKGYLKRDDLTNEKFIDFSYTHKKIYNTNDLAYLKEDGEIVHLGRTDYQVKIRGYRIELGEIENVISNFDGITNCAVIYNDNLKKLYAFYTANEDTSIQDLKNHIINNLPIYMMPSKFIKLDEMPHTPNGKLDRNSLKHLELLEDNEKIILPTTQVQKKLYEIISNIISNKEFGITDDFFSIGMDSLNMIKLSSIIQKEFGINLSSSKIYKMFNIKEVAEYLDTSKSCQIKGVEKSSKQDFYPLSCAQKRIYYASKMSNNPLVYNICGGLVVDNKLDKNKVTNIFNELIKKHSSFRTCFKIIDNEPKQVVLDELKLDIKSHNHKKVNINDLINNFPKPFDFEKAPLLRVELHYMENGKTLLLIDSHHIILDGSSLNILINEFCKLYNNETIEDEKIDYKDFTIWENDFIKSNEFKNLEKNWQDFFKGVDIPAINLPYDFSFTQTKTYNGNTISLEIPQNLFKGLETVAKNHKVSNYVLFLSAFYTLLYRYTSQDTIIVGSPISGRFDTSLENTLGMFVNNIPLIANINSHSTFAEFMNTLKETVLTAIDNGMYPYDMLVKSLKLNTYDSLFDVMFTYQNENDDLPKIEDAQIDIIYANTKTSKFNLSLEIIPTTNTLNLEYNTDLFKEDTINLFIKHYLNILENILNNPKTKLSELEILSNEEKNKILYEFNNTYLDYPKDKSIAKMFEEQVQKNPEKIALVFGDEILSFIELNKKANELANYLKKQNIGRGDIVGIMIPRSLELVVSILACLKCGSCYIPIDPHFPIDRISYMLENSNAKVLLTAKDTYSKTQYNKKQDVSFDNLNIYSGNKNNLDVKIKPEDNSYIIYTSGSTGNPKGVVLKYSSLTNLAYHLNNNLEFFKNPELATMCSVTTASFDIFLFESILCLVAGLDVVIANEDEQKIPTKLNALIEKNNINAIQMTPSRMQFFLDNIADFPALKNLKYVILAGEPLPEKLLKDILKLGVKKVYNGYGPSETTVFSTFTDVTNQDIVTIGKPLANSQMYILDKNLNPCPIGVLGELYIAGDGVGNGYLNNIELTSKSYIQNPFIKNSIMYKVGDLCKYTESGEILCLGRVDNQIKIRGLRIELGEIENKMLEFPFIQKCVVVKQAINVREFISAYYIAEKRIKVSELRAFLAKSLPDYMVPSYFTAIEDFPYTPNGKIDKKSLPLPDLSKKDTNNFVAPKTDLEIKLSHIFESILGVSPIGIYDNFFELGGDSILAMRLNVELLKISSKITYADIFDNPTISSLINLLNDTHKNQTALDDIDNSKYEKLLNKNIIFPDKFTKKSFKNILLTGSTGFLGIHILDAILQNKLGKVYCIIRNEPGITAKTKLLNKLNYYFGDKYNNLIDKKIFIIDGDISKDKLGLSESDYYKLGVTADIVINSAAKVDHFGKYETFYNINVKGVQNLLDFCNIYKNKFYQISTLSVSGNSFVDDYASNQNFSEDVEFRENNFYISQTISNVYIKTKFEAEKIILDAALNGTDCYILRVGNLMPRFKDGVFQENYEQNAYLNRLTAFLKLGVIPDNIYNAYLEFTPIDYCANAIIKITQYQTKNNRIFHIFNHNHIYLKKLLKFLNDLNYNIDVIDENKFKNTIKNILESDSKKEILNNLINDFGKDLSLNYESNIKIKSDFTIKYLEEIGFNWPDIDLNYIKYILKLIESR